MTNLPRVIGLYSHAPQQGKSTVAQYLRNSYGYQVVSFATPLKRMASHMLHGLGYSPQEIDGFLTEGKSIRLAEIGVDTRHILQTLGAEWGRNCIHPDLWVFMWQRQVKHILDLGGLVVVDDVRFQNEYEALHQMHPDTQFWRIQRDFSILGGRTGHISEGFAENNSRVHTDAWINNDGSKQSLFETVSGLMPTGPVNADA